jgi:two-component system, chemotaxis family, protein-glutamate methylesterase/glutaminase
MNNRSGKPIRVLVVDDSALVRKMLSEILGSDPQIEVVGTAPDPYVAREKIKQLNPDVLTLDVEMPKMDGVTFLKNLMRLRPMPVLMISSLTEKGADVTLQALEYGAIDFVKKPGVDVARGLQDYVGEIISKVKMAARAKVDGFEPPPAVPRPIPPKLSADVVIKPDDGHRHFKTTEAVIAIGASTGGTEAIKEVIRQMPPDAPGIVIAQHIPKAFSEPFARRLDGIAAMSVCEASDGQQILPGHVYIAPGDRHLLVRRSGARYICHLDDGLPVNRHRPSVDVLFRSVAQQIGPNAIGVILTGMGDDGAHGLREMLDAGAYTLAQDEATSVVWGMPGRACELGAAMSVLPLKRIAQEILDYCSNRASATGTG